MSDNLPPLTPCPDHAPVAISTPVLLRSALEGPPISNPSAGAGAIIDPDPMVNGDNELIVVANADGAAGNAISFEVSNPANSVVPSVQVSGNAITVVNAARARLLVSNAEDNRFNGIYYEAGNWPGTTHPMWVKINAGPLPARLYCPDPDISPTVQWVFDLSDGVPFYASQVTNYDFIEQPQNLIYHNVITSVDSALVVNGIYTSADQAATAVNLSPAASALVTATPVGTGQGAIEFTPSVFLMGGIDGSPGTLAAGIGQFSRVGPYFLTPPRTEAYDWFIAETLDSWRQVFN